MLLLLQITSRSAYCCLRAPCICLRTSRCETAVNGVDDSLALRPALLLKTLHLLTNDLRQRLHFQRFTCAHVTRSSVTAAGVRGKNMALQVMAVA